MSAGTGDAGRGTPGVDGGWAAGRAGPGRVWQARHEAAGPKSATKETREGVVRVVRVDSVVG